MIQPHAVLQVSNGVLDLGMAAVVGLQLQVSPAAARYALRSLACRHHQLSHEVQDLNAEPERLTQTTPILVSAFGIGPNTAATLLTTAESNLDRLHSEAAFAALSGVNPIPASSGKTNRHRLNRGGDRQANAALHRVIVIRLRYDRRTKAHMCRRIGRE